MSGSTLDDLFAVGRRNAMASWLLTGVSVVVGLGLLVVGAYVWTAFAFTVVALALLPPLAFRSREVMLPWEVLALAALPLIGLAIGTQRFTTPIFTYLAIAALALVIVVELDSFTTIRMSPGFAVVLVVAATMAAAAVWAILQWGVSIALDRSFDMTNDDLMIEFLYSTLAGVGAGVLFWTYFQRHVAPRRRFPVDVPEGDHE